MERASRVILVSSLLLAGVVHAWLASGRPGLAAAAGAAFAVTFLLARFSLPAALVPVLLATYLAPAIFVAAFGVSDYNTMLIWLAALAGPVLARADLRGWHLPGRWAVPLAMWALIVAISWPVVALREIDFSLVAARTFDTTNAAYPAAPPLAAAFVVIVAMGVMLAVLWIDLLWEHFAGDRLHAFEGVVVVPLLVSVAIGAGAALYQGLFDIRWLNVWRGIDRAGGLMLDPNTFAIGAAMWGPAGVALAWRMRRSEVPAIVLLSALVIAIWFAGSRTALVALCVGLIAIAAGVLQRRGRWHPMMGYGAAGALVAALLLAMAFAPRDSNSTNPLQRAFDRLPRLERAEMQRFAEEMWGRFGYGTAAAAITRDHPVVGVGVGSFHIVSADYLYRRLGRRVDPDNAQNWWRHQVAELGGLGASPSLWVSLLVLATVVLPGPGTSPVGPSTVLRGVIAGVGVASLLGVPTQHPASMISFATLLFYLTALPTLDARHRYWDTRRRSAAVWAVGLTGAMVVATGLFITARGELRVADRARASGLPYAYGLGPVDGVSEFGDLRWSATRSVAVVPVPHQWLQVTLWTPHPDVAAQAVTIDAQIDHRRVIAYESTTQAPQTFYVRLPEQARWTLIELAASREVRPGHAVQFALAWLRELPAGVPAERVK